jgi:hypothetical protein
MIRGDKKLVFIVTCVLLIISVRMHADLRDYVVVLKPVVSSANKTNLSRIADYYEEQHEISLANAFRLLSQGSNGTGFIITDKYGENFILTSSQVVAHAESVNAEVRKSDGTLVQFKNCPVVLLHDELNLAVLQFPNKERIFSDGFRIDTGVKRDGLEVWAAGYPHLLGKPSWQFAKGIITNRQAKISEIMDPDLSFLIQHSINIDTGYSGSPLLVKDNRSAIGYSVIGVNMWLTGAKENAYYAIPAENITHTLERLKQVEKIKDDVRVQKQSLVDICISFAQELKNPQPNPYTIKKYISYVFADESGLQSFISVLNLSSIQETKEWQQDFLFCSPVEIMRKAIFMLFWYRVHNQNQEIEVRFKEINFADEQNFMQNTRIRTIFEINGEDKEIVWLYESGKWYIADTKLEQIDKAYGKDTPLVADDKDRVQSSHSRGLGFGVMGNLFIEDINPSGEIGIIVDIPIIPFLSMSCGINYCISETAGLVLSDTNHLQIPLLIKAEYIFDFGDPDALFNLGPFFAAGFAYEILVPYQDDFSLAENQNVVFLVKPGVEVEYKPFSFSLYVILMKELIHSWSNTLDMPNFVELAYFGFGVKYNFH